MNLPTTSLSPPSRVTSPQLTTPLPPIPSSPTTMRPNPLTPMTAFAAALLAGLAGYYIGKSSGMRHSETITTLKEIAKSSPARDDDFRPPGGSLSSSVVDLGKGGGEEEEQESSDEEEDGEGVKEFEESRENNLKMVLLSVSPLVVAVVE
ncbi:hypothetical protein EX30DRAFT_129754 [Ascodesmis nigricans]|uniref:Uncharacterized protein n=1 Tax=Ascodesmis nigricans TaxID=341454 RepID=A0A4S2MNL6_9PEZI|nr:hypothetical protein EX30DRAFT_129754 [Ascodesmis nigricans]